MRNPFAGYGSTAAGAKTMFPWGPIIGGLFGLGSTILGNKSQSKASNQQLQANREAIAAEERMRAQDRQMQLALAKMAAMTAYQDLLRKNSVKNQLWKRYGLKFDAPPAPDFSEIEKLLGGAGGAAASSIPGYTPGSAAASPVVKSPAPNYLASMQSRRLQDELGDTPAQDASPWGGGFSEGGGFGTLRDMYNHGGNGLSAFVPNRKIIWG